MSEILKNKMLLHTATPAKGVWESIAFQLNAADNKEQEADAFFATKLTALEVVPPPMAWNNIAAQFDTEVSQNQSQLASKILAYEVSPPTKVWDKIATVLNKEVAKVISITQSKKYAPVYKMAAAAVAVLVLGTGLWFALQKNNTTLTNNAEKITAKNNATNNSTSVTPNAADTALLASETQEKKITEKEVNTKQEKIGNPNSTIKNTEFATTDIIPLTQNPFDNKTEKLQNQSGDVVVDIDLVNTPNTYMTIVGPDGQSVRISSKFSKQLGYFTDRSPESMENIDFIIKESTIWKNKIAGWRSQMNSSSLAPSISNFMDVVEFSKLVSEKK